MRVRIAQWHSVRGPLLAALLVCATLDRTAADTLETWDDLDALVTNVYATMGFAAGISTLPPPAPMRVWQGLALVPFDPAGLPGLTNNAAPVPLVGIDTWGVSVVETQLATRAWICFGADGTVLRTNSAAELCDPQTWLTVRYGQPPSWLGGAELADWIASRERARVSLRLRLVPAENYAALCDLLAAYATNAVPPQANDPVAPVDTNRVAFAGLLPRADETHLRFWLYAPQDHLPVDLFGSATRAPPSDWFHVGQLDATTPFTSWEMPDLGISGFFLAARADIDTDGDRLPDAREWLLYGTDSTVADTDADGIDDGDEVERTDTAPGNPDSDGDGLDDGDEVEQTDTDPGNPDSDGDGMWDFAEIATGTSPSDPADALETNSAVMVEIVWPEAQGGPDFRYRGLSIDAVRWTAGQIESGYLALNPPGDYWVSPAGRRCLCLIPGQTVTLGVWVEGALGYTGAPADATVTLAGYGPSAALCIQDGDPIGIVAPSDVELYTFYCILQADLDIDSDNSAGLGTPEGTLAEDRIEDDPTLPGKVIVANDDDSDDDGVPDFADGYNRDGSAGNADDASTNDCFVPLVLRIPALPGSMGPAALRLSYSASDPAAVTVSGTPPLPSPAPGHLRIWTRNADHPRNPAVCTAATPGDYVPPGDYADLAALGFVDGPGTVTLYVEGIAPTNGAGEQRITVELDPDGPGEVHGWVVTDAVRVTVLKVEIKNPIDSDTNGRVDDFAATSTNRTGNAFDYDRGATNACAIPCRVQVHPDTAEVRSMFAGKVTAALTAVSDAGFTSTLTWDSSVPGDPTKGALVYNSTSAFWEATATFTSLPEVPSNSWGRVPKGLHDLLYGNRTAAITVHNPIGGGTFLTDSTSYEVYFGDSLVIDGTKLAETTLNYSNHISGLIGATPLRREIFDKMNCSTQVVSFADDTKASQNFTMRCRAVEVMDGMNLGTIDVGYFNQNATPPVHPRSGATTYNTATTNWTIAAYWSPVNANNAWCWQFSQKPGTSAHSAINNVTPYRGECAGAMEISIFQASDAALGASTFDTVHVSGSLGLGDWGTDFGTHCAPLTDQATFVPGDYVYMKNKDDYSTWAPTGYWQGENCLYMGLNASDQGLFSGLGEHRKTESELREELHVAYTNDCFPHTVANPTVEIRFTARFRTVTGD